MPLEGNQTRLENHITERNMLPTSRPPTHTCTSNRTHSLTHVLAQVLTETRSTARTTRTQFRDTRTGWKRGRGSGLILIRRCLNIR